MSGDSENGGALRAGDTVPVAAMDDAGLARLRKQHGLSLTHDELRLIATKLARDPTLTELHIFNIEWSEHCSYKSSKRILRSLPTKAPNVILGPSEDAGIVEFAVVDGERYGVVLRQESHNHPSHIVPYEGAATGVGGIVRDILCMGAKVVGLSDPLRFGNPSLQKTKYLATTVIDGIAGYGNAIGVPNLCGDIAFNASFDDNCLVNVACLGIVREKDIIHSYAPEGAAGYDIVLVGKATDSSGFGGAAFASVTMDDEAQHKSAVQVPDPFLKNVIIRASYAVFEEVRAQGISAGFKDCGAGGIMCATSELGASGGVGVRVDIDKVPVSMEMPAFMTACSETQERLVWMVPKSFTPTLLRVYNEDFALPEVAERAQASVIGEVIAQRDFILVADGEEIAHAPIAEVTEGITYEREARERTREAREPDLPEPDDYAKAILDVLAYPDVASKARAYKHYDTEVQGMAVIRPGEADAGVIKPLPDSDAAIAISSDCNPLYGRISAYWCAANAVAECMRNVAAVGAVPSAFTNCLNFGNPERPEVLWEFTEAVRGLADACNGIPHKLHGGCVPIVSGNVSFYNESTRGTAIDPSPHVTCVGILDDYAKAITMRVKREGSALCLIGPRKDELGGSVHYQLQGELGANVPTVDFAAATREIHAVIDLIGARLCLACHDISDGGLAACVAEMLLGGEGDGAIGASLSLEGGLRTSALLFSQTGGFVLEIAPEHLARCEELCRDAGVALTRIGETIAAPELRIAHNHKAIARVPLARLAHAWLTGLEEALR